MCLSNEPEYDPVAVNRKLARVAKGPARLPVESFVCSSCVQRILLMPVDKLKEAAARAEQRGEMGKVAILNSYLEEVSDEGSDIMARSAIGSRRTRSLRNEEKPVRQAQKHKRASLRQAVKHQSGVSLPRSSGVANAEPQKGV
jgi:hypothetical protein